jgi:multiple sugar transport system substrate-binding protein
MEETSARDRDLSRRDFLKLSGAGLLGASTLGSCARVSSGFTGAETVPEGTLIFSFGPDDTGTQPIIDKFNKENPDGITVLYREMPSDTGQYFDKIRTDFQAGGGAIDIIGGDVIWPAQFGPNGWILDLSDRFPKQEQDKFLPSTIEAMTFDDKIYGVPWYTDAGMLYYRKDLLDEAGIGKAPETWDELIGIAQEVQGKTGTRFGLVFQGAEYEGGVVNGLEHIYNAGAEVIPLDDPTKVTIANGPSAEGLATERKLVESGVAPPAVATYKELESQNAFIQGDAIFMRNWPFVYGTVLGGKAAGSLIKPEQVGVVPLPTIEGSKESFSGQGGWNFFINSSTKDPDGAFKFIQYMTSEKIMRHFAVNASLLPPRQSLYEDQELLKKQPVMELAKDVVTRTKPRPQHPFYSDMSLVMADQFGEVVKGNIAPDDAVTDLQHELDRLVDLGTEVYDL